MRFPGFSRSYLNVLEPRQVATDSSTSTPTGGIVGYSGAMDSPMRSSVNFQLGARREITRYTRLQILKKVRALEANLGLIRRMKGQVAKYSVGRGVFPQPQTSDDAWNVEAAMKFDDWANNRVVCDAAGAMTFWERQRFHAETLFAEGESFDAMISSSFAGAPMLQLFDNSEIGSPYAVNPPGYQDGVLTNGANRPIKYLATTESGGPGQRKVNTRPIDAFDMIHLARRTRANQVRVISPFAPGVNCAIDKVDLRTLITAAAKLHEAMGVVVKRKSGDAGKTGVTNQLKKELGADGKLTEVKEGFLGGALAHYCGIDEEIEIVSSDRPTQNLMQWGDELGRDICLGTELNFEIVWNLMTLGGATARIALADAQWFFDLIQDALNEMLNQRVWVWWCASMMNSKQLPECKDPRWWACHWQGPPKLTADAGRTMQQEIDALRNGLSGWGDYYSRAQGRFWKVPVKDRIDEIAWAMAYCKEKQVPFELFFEPTPGAQMLAPVGKKSDAGPADKEKE